MLPRAPAPPAGGGGGGGETYPLEQLKAGASWPAGIDIKEREKYLSDADFVTAFKMERAAYAALPNWKKANEKKKAGFF